MQQNSIKIEVLKPLGKEFPAGKVVHVLADKHGTPLEQFWRKRLKDSKRDSCCRVMSESKKTKTKKEGGNP